jgi:amino acid transporter
MVFAFSRDGAMPGSALWVRVSTRNGTPTRAVGLAVVAALVLALPSLYSPAAYGAVTAINVIGITPAYAIPIFLRLRAGRNFTPGPWSLGRWSTPVGVVAVAWVAVVTVLFCLPQTQPVNATSFNYAPVALAVVLALATGWWWRARRSYATPVHASPEMAELESDVV